MTIIRDITGRERSVAWLQSIFGTVAFLGDAGAELELYEVWAMCDPQAGLQERGRVVGAPAAVRQAPFEKRAGFLDGGFDPGAVIVVHVEDERGEPVEGVEVARWWPDNSLPALPAGLATWNATGIHGTTNAAGDVGFGMGRGDFYDPAKGSGASWLWAEDGEGLGGVGMVAGTSHWTLWPVLRRRGDDPVDPPPPDSGYELRFLDEQGNPVDEADIERDYGPQDVSKPNKMPVWALVELRCEHGDNLPHPLTIQCLDEEGRPAAGVRVTVAPVDVDGERSNVTTDENGQARVDMTKAHRFAPPGRGHYLVAVLDGDSQVWNSAGWVQGQHRWLNPVFRYRAADVPPVAPPPGPGVDLEAVRANLTQLHELVHELEDLIGRPA